MNHTEITVSVHGLPQKAFAILYNPEHVSQPPTQVKGTMKDHT